MEAIDFRNVPKEDLARHVYDVVQRENGGTETQTKHASNEERKQIATIKKVIVAFEALKATRDERLRNNARADVSDLKGTGWKTIFEEDMKKSNVSAELRKMYKEYLTYLCSQVYLLEGCTSQRRYFGRRQAVPIVPEERRLPPYKAPSADVNRRKEIVEVLKKRAEFYEVWNFRREGRDILKGEKHVKRPSEDILSRRNNLKGLVDLADDRINEYVDLYEKVVELTHESHPNTKDMVRRELNNRIEPVYARPREVKLVKLARGKVRDDSILDININDLKREMHRAGDNSVVLTDGRGRVNTAKTPSKKQITSVYHQVVEGSRSRRRDDHDHYAWRRPTHAQRVAIENDPFSGLGGRKLLLEDSDADWYRIREIIGSMLTRDRRGGIDFDDSDEDEDDDDDDEEEELTDSQRRELERIRNHFQDLDNEDLEIE